MLLVCKKTGLVQGSPVEHYPDWIQLDETCDWHPQIEVLPFYPTSELGTDLLNQVEEPLRKAILTLERSLVNWFLISSVAKSAFIEIGAYYKDKHGECFPLNKLMSSGDPTFPEIPFRISGDMEHFVDLIAMCCVKDSGGLNSIWQIIKKAAKKDFDDSEVLERGGSFSVLALTYPSRPHQKIFRSPSGLFSLSLCLACSGAYHLTNAIHHKDQYDTVQFVVPHVEPLLTDLTSTLERCSSIVEITCSKQSEI